MTATISDIHHIPLSGRSLEPHTLLESSLVELGIGEEKGCNS